MPTRDPEAAHAARLGAGWWLILLVAGAAILGTSVVLASWALAAVGVLLLAAAVLLLGWAALRGGRGDEPRLRARF